MTQTTSKPSSALAPKETYAIATMSDALGELLAENIGQGGLSPFDLDRVKVPGGGATTWEIPSIDGTTEAKELTGVIAAWADKRSYWEKDMEDSGGGSPPDCTSEDGNTGIGKPGGNCWECPLAQFGSGKNNAQACKSMKFVFLVQPKRMLPVLLAVPPSSLSPFKKYMLGLAGAGRKYNHVVTKFTLEKTKNAGGITYAKIVCVKDAQLEPETIAAVERYSAALKPLISRIGVQRQDFED